MSDFNTFEKLGESCEICVTKEHTFGTDAFLLADFAKARHKDIVCDLGTGCGIIAVLMRLRYEPKQVYGVDIQPQAIEQFELTVSRSGLKETYPLLMDLKALTNDAPLGRCDLVTCNPPYKAPGAGLKNPDGVCAAARHEVACTLSDIISVSARLLQTAGRLCMCQRPERLAEIMAVMRENKLEPKRLRLVCKKVGEEPWLVLTEARKCGNTGLRIEPTLYVYENGEYSPEMIRIYGPYKEAYL